MPGISIGIILNFFDPTLIFDKKIFISDKLYTFVQRILKFIYCKTNNLSYGL